MHNSVNRQIDFYAMELCESNMKKYETKKSTSNIKIIFGEEII